MTLGLRSTWMSFLCCTVCLLAALAGNTPTASAETPLAAIPVFSGTLSTAAGPGPVAIDGSGNVWVMNYQRAEGSELVEYSPTGSLLRRFKVREAEALAINKLTETIYVSVPIGTGGSKIDEYSTEGKLEGSFERKAYGEHESFDYSALAVDPAGNIWATDQHNYQIDEFSPKGTFIAAYGTAGSGQKEFNGPDGIAIDHEEHIYVADINNHRILEMSTTGAFIREFGFQGKAPSADPDWFPREVTIDSRTNTLIVTATELANEKPGENLVFPKIEIYTPTGVYLSKFGPETAHNEYTGIAVDSYGGIYLLEFPGPPENQGELQKWVMPNPLWGQSGWYSVQEESGGEPVTASVNVAGGNLAVESEDLPNETATANLRLDRYYNSQSTSIGGPLSPHWAWDAGPDLYLIDRDESVVLHGPSGYVVTLQRSGSTYTAPEEFEGTLTKNTNGTYTLAEMSGITIQFNTTGAMTSYSNAEGKSFTVNDTTLSGQSVLHSLAPATGKALEVTYSGTHVTTTTDPAGHIRHYEYNAQNELSIYTDPAGHKTEYGYETAGPLNKITTSNGTIETITTTAGKVTEVTITPKGEAAYKDKFEYVTPTGPTCSTTVDTGETIVTHPPESGTPEIYCWEALGQVTAYSGPPSEAEEDPTEETGKEQPELPANTCYTNPNFPEGYCGQEDPLPENEEGAEGLFTPLVSIPDLGPTHYGIADNNTVSPFDIFTNPQFTALHVVNVRRTFPWNAVWEAKHSTIPKNKEVAEAEVTDFKTWVKDVKALGSNTGQPTVSFNYCAQGGEWVDPLEPAKHEPCTKAPTEPEYAAAVKEFLETETLKEVKYFSAWNEPNNNKIAGEPKGIVAGEYWRALDTLCAPKAHNCLVAAGEFVDSAMTDANDEESAGGKYFAEYFKGMGHPPTAYRWAWHAYSDGEATYALRGTPSKWWKRFKNFRNAVDRVTKNTHKPDIWLTEQGAIYSAFDKKDVPAKNSHVATEIMHAYVEDGTNQLTRQSKQITRFFYYQVRGTPLGIGNWDSGLLYPTGTARPRPMYWIYKAKTPKS